MGRHSTALKVPSPEDVILTPPASPAKRKREDNPVPEIEVDVTASEPPSKKSLRKAKKAKSEDHTHIIDGEILHPRFVEENGDRSAQDTLPNGKTWGIWIGNLPWSMTKQGLREFFKEHASIDDDNITRLHMPPPNKATQPQQRLKPQNKGFAYVDFSSEGVRQKAVELSEKLLQGRRVLIKHSDNFEGRPDPTKSKEEGSTVLPGKPASKRIFVGNLGFDVSPEDLETHYTQCGNVENIKVATFEDSGKCKGYAWVHFEELSSAESAVRGYILRQDQSEEEDDSNELKKAPKKAKPRKWWVNQLQGRPLRAEFAEDPVLRYQKRFGKKDRDAGSNNDSEAQQQVLTQAEGLPNPERIVTRRREPRLYDARNIKPGAALASAARLTGAIVEPKGKKLVFD